MKKIFSLMVCLVTLLACLSLSSCSKDDDESSSSLVGSWKMDDSGSEQIYLIFKSNGTVYSYYTYTYGKNTYEGAEKATYKYSGSTLTIYTDEGKQSGKVTIKGKTMTVYGEEDGEEYTETYTKTSQPISDSELEELCDY